MSASRSVPRPALMMAVTCSSYEARVTVERRGGSGGLRRGRQGTLRGFDSRRLPFRACAGGLDPRAGRGVLRSMVGSVALPRRPIRRPIRRVGTMVRMR